MADLPLISLQNVDCSFYVRKSRLALRQVEVLRDFSLDIHAGETLGIVGHNGAGKSTLLQILGRILEPTAGKAHFRDGLSISLLTLQLGFSQELTGRENAVLGAMYLGFSRKEAEARLERILEFAEIGEWADEPVRTYSTGMGARLGFAVAMEMEPDVMLIDETLGVGDAYFQQKSGKALREKMQSGQTTVLVAHSDAVLQELCSRVAWVHDGRVLMEGEPAKVLKAYSNWVGTLSSEVAGVKSIPLAPALDVVIVNYNGADWNLSCLESLLSQAQALRHVIFVDNASTDGSFEQVVQHYSNDPHFIFLPQQHNALFAAGCNRGIEKALELEAEYVFLLNNDTIVEPECLDALCAFVQSRADVGGAQPLLVRMNDPQKVASAGCRISRMGGAWDHSAGVSVDELPPHAFAVPGISGGACLWKADVLRQIGLFDESFGMYFEDVDLALRARKAGWELYTLPQARVRHMVSASTNKEPSGFCVRFCQANALRLLCKHWPKTWFWADVVCWLGVSTLACLSNLYQRKPALSRAIGLGICDGLRYFRSGLRTRRSEDIQRNDALKPWIDRKYMAPPSAHD